MDRPHVVVDDDVSIDGRVVGFETDAGRSCTARPAGSGRRAARAQRLDDGTLWLRYVVPRSTPDT
ncbi:hypothetical protein [Terrabacter sp. MAHUQ-38]|jgi:hypothetical protein|uniref:hypothetical protein n=1 Tax=unclassified Terrabacter TaxID=2630222 RepID=UPI00165E1172|nr:hypothetical protein [Terrabacter sp. MAHUQ-38]MBC9819813.1 hypothetical protein [Terrabacter sp. MAHUQ-38]